MRANSELQESCGSPSVACDTWASIAAASCRQPPEPGSLRAQLAEDTRRMQDQQLLGTVTFEALSQRFDRIDQGGNSDGRLQRSELTTFIQRQQGMAEGARDRNALLGAQQALDYMNANQREHLTRDDVNAGLKDGMMPDARNMGAAAKQYDSIVSLMRQSHPNSIENGNQVQVRALRQELAQRPERFSREQQEAINTLLQDAYNVSNSVGFFNTIRNWIFGSEGRYVSAESIAERSHRLGNHTGIVLPMNAKFARTL